MSDQGFKVWECELCGFVYDEAEGYEPQEIPPGTRWEEFPDWWCCPLCAATKRYFFEITEEVVRAS